MVAVDWSCRRKKCVKLSEDYDSSLPIDHNKKQNCFFTVNVMKLNIIIYDDQDEKISQKIT